MELDFALEILFIGLMSQVQPKMRVCASDISRRQILILKLNLPGLSYKIATFNSVICLSNDTKKKGGLKEPFVCSGEDEADVKNFNLSSYVVYNDMGFITAVDFQSISPVTNTEIFFSVEFYYFFRANVKQ